MWFLSTGSKQSPVHSIRHGLPLKKWGPVKRENNLIALQPLWPEQDQKQLPRHSCIWKLKEAICQQKPRHHNAIVFLLTFFSYSLFQDQGRRSVMSKMNIYSWQTFSWVSTIWTLKQWPFISISLRDIGHHYFVFSHCETLYQQHDRIWRVFLIVIWFLCVLSHI